jgi:hypothetical protein
LTKLADQIARAVGRVENRYRLAQELRFSSICSAHEIAGGTDGFVDSPLEEAVRSELVSER